MNFRDRINNFFRGRYVYDELNRFLIVLYAILVIFNLLIRLYVLNIFGLVILIILLFRMLSRNYEKRRAENKKFMEITAPFRIWLFNMRDSSKLEYRLFICPKCRQKVRVPKGRGKIQITCPKCSNKFVKRS